MQRRTEQSRLSAVGLLGLIAALCALSACAGLPSDMPSSPAPAPSGSATPDAAAPLAPESSPSAHAKPEPRLVVAWQPSHQDDTGFDGWHEYRVCGDIVKRAIAELPDVKNVLAWDTGHGLTGSNNYRPDPTNTRAFDVEVAKANRADADVFIAVHVNGGAPSSEFAEVTPGDSRSRAAALQLVKALHEQTGLPDLGVIPMRLYSLEPSRNKAAIRVLLEIGDNEADRTYLSSASGRQEIAEALAGVIKRMEAGEK